MYKSDILKGLTIKIAKGDTKAFSSFYDLYFLKVFQFSRYFIQSDFICQEIASDVFLSIWNNRINLPDIENVTSYLFIVTRNKSFDYLEKHSKLPETQPDIPFEISQAELNPEEYVLYKELESAVQIAINELPERCRMIFLLSREENLRYKDIAQMLSISEKTVQAQIITAMKKLGTALKKYFYIFL